MACNLLLPHEDNIANKFRILKDMDFLITLHVVLQMGNPTGLHIFRDHFKVLFAGQSINQTCALACCVLNDMIPRLYSASYFTNSRFNKKRQYLTAEKKMATGW